MLNYEILSKNKIALRQQNYYSRAREWCQCLCMLRPLFVNEPEKCYNKQ